MDDALTKQIWRIANDLNLEADEKLARIRNTIESYQLSRRGDGTRCAACGQTVCDPLTCSEWA